MDFSQLDKHIETLKNCQYIQDANAVKIICDMAKSLLAREENVIYLSAPITVRQIPKINYFILNRFVVIFMVNFTI